MGKEKDIAEKTLEEYNDVFADILNAVLFEGRQAVLPEELSDAVPRGQLKLDGKLHEQERDVAKTWRHGELRIAFYGLENQTEPDRDMPPRVIGYDGGNYKEQVVRRQAASRNGTAVESLYPVITLVLYFGTKRWTGPRRLRECFGAPLPPELEPFVQDYGINLVELAFLTPEQVERFKSDFRIVVDYLVQTRTKDDYQPSEQIITHVDALLKLMGAVTCDERFVEHSNFVESEGKERLNMCVVLDRVEARGEARGKALGEALGEARGKTLGKLSTLADLVHDRLLPLHEAAIRAGMSEAEFEAHLKNLYPDS